MFHSLYMQPSSPEILNLSTGVLVRKGEQSLLEASTSNLSHSQWNLGYMGNSLEVVVHACVYILCIWERRICTRNYRYFTNIISSVQTFCHTMKSFKSKFLKSSKDPSYFTVKGHNENIRILQLLFCVWNKKVPRTLMLCEGFKG